MPNVAKVLAVAVEVVGHGCNGSQGRECGQYYGGSSQGNGCGGQSLGGVFGEAATEATAVTAETKTL